MSEDKEKSTYLGEGVFAKNARFDVWKAMQLYEAQRKVEARSALWKGILGRISLNPPAKFEAKAAKETINLLEDTMNDRQMRLDELEKAHRAKKEQRQAEEKRKYDEAMSRRYARENKKEAERAQRVLERHRRRFKCYICKCPSDGPSVSHEEYYPEIGDDMANRGGSGQNVHYHTTTDWDNPSNLRRCDMCHRWTCSKDRVRGVCTRCADILIKKNMTPEQGVRWKKWGPLSGLVEAIEDFLE